MTTTQKSPRYFIQRMSGTVHTDRNCSFGTPRYRPVPASICEAEVEARMADGRLKACKHCPSSAVSS